MRFLDGDNVTSFRLSETAFGWFGLFNNPEDVEMEIDALAIKVDDVTAFSSICRFDSIGGGQIKDVTPSGREMVPPQSEVYKQ